MNIINNTPTTKQNLIFVSSPLTKDVNNNITIDLSSYSTTGNDPNYLKLSGGILTGNLSASNISASEFTGSGTNIFNLNCNKILYNKPNLNLYALKSYVDGSLNIINEFEQFKNSTNQYRGSTSISWSPSSSF